MQVRNMLVAAGAVLAGVTAIAAAPTAASAQEYRTYERSYQPAYAQTYRPAYTQAYGYGHDRFDQRRYFEQRREAELRREYWARHHHREAYRAW
jgi:hypothetical protein